jgi:hypothetical protein
MSDDDIDPARLIECPQCNQTVPFSHMRRLPTAADVPGDELTEEHVACATCLGEQQKIDGHFLYEWWIQIGRFCTSFERCASYIASFIVTYRKKTGKDPVDVDVTAGELVKQIRKLLEADGRELKPQRDRVERFAALTKLRNEVIHSAWSFPQTRADPRDEPDRTDVLETSVYDHEAGKWKERTISFLELQAAVKQAEGLSSPLCSLFFIIPNLTSEEEED